MRERDLNARDSQRTNVLNPIPTDFEDLALQGPKIVASVYQSNGPLNRTFYPLSGYLLAELQRGHK